MCCCDRVCHSRRNNVLAEIKKIIKCYKKMYGRNHNPTKTPGVQRRQVELFCRSGITTITTNKCKIYENQENIF